MRDPNRILLFTYKLQKYWLDRPDLRFGQIVELLKSELSVDDLFNIEEDKLMNVLDELIKGKSEFIISEEDKKKYSPETIARAEELYKKILDGLDK